jgi:hypothetical protein
MILTQESVDLLRLGHSVETPRGFAFCCTLPAPERRIALAMGKPPVYYVCFPTGKGETETRHVTPWEALQALARLGG